MIAKLKITACVDCACPVDLVGPFRLEESDQGEDLLIIELPAESRHDAAQLTATLFGWSVPTAAGYRVYKEVHLRRLHFIERAKALGFSSDWIRELLDLHDPVENHTRAAVKSLTNPTLKRLPARFAICSASSVASARYPRIATARRRALIPVRFWNLCSTIIRTRALLCTA
jgi:DNA-binding transcriptional MerR regulator